MAFHPFSLSSLVSSFSLRFFTNYFDAAEKQLGKGEKGDSDRHGRCKTGSQLPSSTIFPPAPGPLGGINTVPLPSFRPPTEDQYGANWRSGFCEQSLTGYSEKLILSSNS